MEVYHALHAIDEELDYEEEEPTSAKVIEEIDLGYL